MWWTKTKENFRRFLTRVKPHWVEAISTLFIAFFTIALFSITSDQRDIADTANQILARQSKILDRQNVSLERQVRAYVSARPFPRINGVSAGKGAQTAVIYRNSGQTPAWNVSLRAKIDALSNPPTPTKENFHRAPPRDADTYLVPTGEPRDGDTFNIDRDLTQSKALAVIAGGDTKLYVWGVIFYEDIFAARHKSYFCFKYFGQSNNDPRAVRFRGYCAHPKND